MQTEYKTKLIRFDQSLKIGGSISQVMLRKGSRLDTKRKDLTTKTEYADWIQEKALASGWMTA